MKNAAKPVFTVPLVPYRTTLADRQWNCAKNILLGRLQGELAGLSAGVTALKGAALAARLEAVEKLRQKARENLTGIDTRWKELPGSEVLASQHNKWTALLIGADFAIEQLQAQGSRERSSRKGKYVWVAVAKRRLPNESRERRRGGDISQDHPLAGPDFYGVVDGLRRRSRRG